MYAAKQKLSHDSSGYSLVELITVVMIIGIIATVALKALRGVNESARSGATVQELDELASAITGKPDHRSGGSRTDFGYVGDIGALPPNLGALVSNPGLGTWQGPYVSDEFYRSSGAGASDFQRDAWGRQYQYNGLTIASTGAGSPMTRSLAGSVADLLYNQVVVTVTDRDNTPPGPLHADSLKLSLTYPDGSGGLVTAVKTPARSGWVEFDSIPIGQHQLQMIYVPDADTTTRLITIEPGQPYQTNMYYHSDVWADTSGTGSSPTSLSYVSGSARAFGKRCRDIRFDICNPTPATHRITSMTIRWNSPEAYYQRIVWDGRKRFNSKTPRNASDDIAPLTKSCLLAPNDTVTVAIRYFCTNQTGGCGAKPNMGAVEFTVEFSEGSTIRFTTEVCGG